MSDEYLWDRSGDPDPLVADLEHQLGALAFEPEFLLEDAAPAAAAAVVAAPARSGWRPYLVGSAVTAAAVACSVLLFWCGYRTGADTPVHEVQPVVVGGDASERADAEAPEVPPSVEDEPAIELDADDDEEDVESPDPPLVADASDAKGKAKSKTKGKTKTGSSKDPLADFPATSSSSSSSTKSSSSSSSAKGSDVDVDCILDPKACGKGKSSSSSSSKPSTSSGSSDPSLPEKLSTTDIRDGVNPVKNAARACGVKHGAKPGEKVKVKLSISGATGEVTSATAEAPHAGTPLGACVAAAIKRAKFKRFQKASLGAVYPITM